jgi:hypothetical protein
MVNSLDRHFAEIEQRGYKKMASAGRIFGAAPIRAI